MLYNMHRNLPEYRIGAHHYSFSVVYHISLHAVLDLTVEVPDNCFCFSLR